MIDKAWIVMIFMYCVSFAFIGTQWMLGDVLQHDLVTFTDVTSLGGTTYPAGTEIKPLFQGFANLDAINTVSVSVTTGDYHPSDNSFFDKVLTSTTTAAFIAWDGVTLLTGTYIFNIMILFGIPIIFVMGFEVVYIFFLIRTAIALIRGV